MACLLITSPAWAATQVDLTTAVQGELRPTIEGRCNLPDGMKLIVRVTRKESAFKSDTPVEVQSGHFGALKLHHKPGNHRNVVVNVSVSRASRIG